MIHSLTPTIVTAAVTALAVVVGGALVGERSKEQDTVLSSSTALLAGDGQRVVTVARLAAALEQHEGKQQELEARLQRLEEGLSRIESRLAADQVGGFEVAPEAVAEPEIAAPETTIAAFVNAGFAPAEAAGLEARYADIGLKRLYLRDRARREGWLSEPRFREEVDKIDAEEAAIREDLGEEAYDRFLYATGQSNRVSVSSVMRRSPAETSGIAVGDIIYRYAGDRIYNVFDLLNGTASGEASAPVAVEVVRGDEIVEVYIPRGPLGVELATASVKP